MRTHADIAAQLIERLLTEPAFRAEFRRDPSGTCRAAGLADLAEEMALSAGGAMMTLDLRESRSSLAGVMMAAAMEGVGVVQFAEHVAPALADVDDAVGDVLSRVNLPAISVPGRGALAGGGSGPVTPAAPVEPLAAAAVEPAPPALSPEPAGAADARAPASPEEAAPDLPRADDLPEPEVAAEADAATPEVAQEARAASAPPPAEAAGGPRPDPSLYGLDGTGSRPTPEVQALLDNKKVTLDADGIADLEAGKIDPRVVAVLTKLSQDHEITVTSICSDHPRMSASGNVSNHAHGRGLDIGTIDGELVRPDSPAAREVAAALAELDASYRPDEVGTPFAIASPGYFTDAAHQDHIHLGFKEPIDPGWKPPDDVAAGAAADGSAGGPAAGGRRPPATAGSGSFLAVTAEAAQRRAGSESGAFLAVTPPVGPPEAVADPAAVPAAVVDAAANAAGGSSSLGARALEIADTQIGIREQGTNAGKEVNEYLAAAGVPSGNPWCASFVTWALEKSGHKMQGGGWAAVATWVQNARQGTNDLKVVSAEDARPGDLVAYDWGGQEDFGADGHIGFLASEVKDGKFTAVEGNWQDAVLKVPRQLGGTTNVKFLRIGGGAAPDVPDAPPARGMPEDAVGAGAAAEAGPNRYPGDDAPKEQIAAWMGREAEKRGLPPELPVMAGLVESNLQNLDYGHSSSLGYFQMLETIWNKGEYAGYPDKPELQLKWFLDTAEGVKKQRIARGLPVDDPSQYGVWIADVERPAEQYRGRYQLRLEEARTLLRNGAGAPPASSGPAVPPATAAPAIGDSGAFMAVTAGTARREGTGAAASGSFMAVEPAAAAEPRAGASSPPAAPEAAPASAGGPEPDAGQYGMAGGGGAVSAEARAVLDNPRITLDGNGKADFEQGKMDPRVAAAILKIAEKHEITITSTTSDHPEFSSGGSRSNHWFGRGIDIGTVDGELVRPNSPASRKVAEALAELDPSIRPTEVGTPWAIAAPGFFTDAGHQDHIHFAYDEPITGDWKSPLAPASPASAAAVTPQPAAPAAPAPPVPAPSAAPETAGASGSFLAVGDGDRASAKAADSGAFMAVADGAARAPEAEMPAAVPASAAGAQAVDLSSLDGDYPGDDAPREQIAGWLAKQAAEAGLPPQLPVMAALVESNLRNLNYGDADSVGFFQMRVGIWNRGEYAGYPENPQLQAKWFIDQALAVKRQRLARGLPVDDPAHFGEWIADVERPAEQYRGRYQLRLAEANNLLKRARR